MGGAVVFYDSLRRREKINQFCHSERRKESLPFAFGEEQMLRPLSTTDPKFPTPSQFRALVGNSCESVVEDGLHRYGFEVGGWRGNVCQQRIELLRFYGL
jgi:hypothetical protein